VSAETKDDGHTLSLCAADRIVAFEALLLAAKLRAEVRLVHVVDFLDLRTLEGDEEILIHVEGSLEGELAQIEAEARNLDVRCSHTFVRGKPWYELTRQAANWPADLLMVSAQRETLSVGDRLLHGSTAARTLRKAPCPVWVVAPREARGITKVLALIDRSPVSRRVVEAANLVANAFDAGKVALHCLDYPDDIVLHRLPDAYRAMRQHHLSERDRARAQLNELTGGETAGWQVLLDDTWVVRRVPELVAELQVDLVVMGSLSRGNVAGLLLGTTAGRLLERCKVSTLVLRPPGWSSPVQF
jgi:universal stress protein E